MRCGTVLQQECAHLQAVGLNGVRQEHFLQWELEPLWAFGAVIVTVLVENIADELGAERLPSDWVESSARARMDDRVNAWFSLVHCLRRHRWPGNAAALRCGEQGGRTALCPGVPAWKPILACVNFGKELV